MAKKIQNGTVDSVTIQNKSFDSVDLTTYVASTTNNQYGTPDYTKTTVRGTLTRNGVTKTVIAGNLWALAKDAYFHNAAFDFDKTPASTTAHVITVSAAAQVKGQHVAPITLPLGGIINCKGDDRFELEIQCNLAGGYVDGAASYILADVNEAIGLEYVTPSTQVYAIQAGQAEWSKNLGQNITRATFLHAEDDAGGELTAEEVLQSVALSSDKLSYNKTKLSLIADRAVQFEANLHRGQCYNLVNSPQGLDGCQLDLLLNATKIAAGECFVVVTNYSVSRQTVAKARRRARKHAAKAVRKMG